jgi:DNA modification methylase
MLESIALPEPIPYEPDPALVHIACLDEALEQHFKSRLSIHPTLNRSLVSFQANRSKPVYRWYKFKEAFSAALAEYLLNKYRITQGRILDPFAGSGTALFVARDLGVDADGIELLPIGQQIIKAKKLIDSDFSPEDVERLIRWCADKCWLQTDQTVVLPELRITRDAYPQETKHKIEQYLYACTQENERVACVLRFALLCVLEAMSFTRKDGQYLRWDYRSARKQGKQRFDKGEIPAFDEAITAKLQEIITDLAAASQPNELFSSNGIKGRIQLLDGSCLKIMPTLPDNAYDALMTSPPYCNRYDYTRTYALELALLGVGEKELVKLRQEMLSCTVENRAKDLLTLNPHWAKAIEATDQQELLQTILQYLDDQKSLGKLNNTGIPRMVRGYFYEMACVIQEAARVLKPNSPLLMVNDNVRYAGASISVDLILSSLAEQLGFSVENILVLPNGKGNSSQQMGEHGRESLRKCIYVWRKR